MLMCSLVFVWAKQPYTIDLPYDPASVVVIDGDTVHVDVNVSNCPEVLCKDLPIRLDGINTPEIHSLNAVEKRYAVMAKNELIAFINRGEFKIYNCTRDKFFRIDCSIVDNNNNDYSKLILDKQLAMPYHGEKKVYDWSKHIINNNK